MKVSIIIPVYNRKDDLARLLDSILNNQFNDYEIIVVDNASEENIRDLVESRQEKNDSIKYVRLEHNMMAAGGRNAGIKVAKGKYLCFIDSDNIIDSNMLGILVGEMENDASIGMAGPLMLYYKDPQRIWFAGNQINMITSKTTYWNKDRKRNELDLKSIFETDHIPNLMMVRKEAQEKIGLFDEQYYIMYEEADFAWRIKNAGYRVVVCPEAITYHNCYLPEEIVDNEMRKLGCENPVRTYHFSKNRGIFIKKYAPWYGKLAYFCFFRFIFAVFYCYTALKNGRKDIAIAWLKGV